MMGFKGFKLVSVKFWGHRILKNNLITFIDEHDDTDSLYTTVFIGSNGTGKSELLRAIVLIYKALSNLHHGPHSIPTLSFGFHLIYSLNGDIYSFTNRGSAGPTQLMVVKDITSNSTIKQSFVLMKNDEIVPFESAGHLPGALVVNSIMLTDKFLVLKNEQEKNHFDFYRYLGVRSRPQQASTRYYVRQTIEFIVAQMDSSVFRRGITRIADFIGLSGSIKVQYLTSHTRKFFNESLSLEVLDNYFKEMDADYKRRNKIAPFKVSTYKSMRKDEQFIKDMCKYVHELVKSPRYQHIFKSSKKRLVYDIADDEDHAQLQEEHRYLEGLRRIGLLSAPEIFVGDKGDVHLMNSSSGEFHFFSTMVGLLATVEPNSLILIDEPEISLHPNWQSSYLTFLRELFAEERYSSCHIIIATHSHFLISDLKGGTAKILGLKKGEKNIEIMEVKSDTYGWSPEQILYVIFGLRSVRNHFIEADITELLGLVSNESKDKEKINDLVKALNSIEMVENDPLNELITEAKEYLSRL